MANIKKNDTVRVITGKDKGKTGKILRVIAKDEKVIVENVNVYKKHQKQGPNREAGIVDKSMPIHVSNVRAVCPKCAEATSFRRKELSDGKRVRFCRKCGETVE
jgi:large subunit ribosomal protein L24